MEDSSEIKKKTFIFANISIALVLIALVFFGFGVIVLFIFGVFYSPAYYTGGGLVLLGFPMGVFSLVKIYRNETKLVGKKRAWTAVVICLTLFILCLLVLLLLMSGGSFDGGC